MRARGELTRARRWVIKIGSTLLTDGGRGLHREAIADWYLENHESHIPVTTAPATARLNRGSKRGAPKRQERQRKPPASKGPR